MHKLLVLGNRVFKLQNYQLEEVLYQNLQNYTGSVDIFYLAKLQESADTIDILAQNTIIRQLISLEYILSDLQVGKYSGMIAKDLLLNINKQSNDIQIACLNITNSKQANITPVLLQFMSKTYIHKQIILFYIEKYIHILSISILMLLIYCFIGISLL